MRALRELQQAFAAAVLAPGGTAPGFAIAGPARAADRIGVYRNAVFANYRNALRASFPVVLRLVGEPFFDAAVDAFVHAHPSVSGDLNVYGDAFGDFLAGYPHAADLPYLADVARLEWAVDEARRAADAAHVPAETLTALAAAPAERLPAMRLSLDPSCRLVASDFPILHIWRANQPGHEHDDRISLDDGADRIVVHRGAEGVALTPVGRGEHAFLAALAAAAPFGLALDAAQRADPAFDLGAALRSTIGAGIITGVGP